MRALAHYYQYAEPYAGTDGTLKVAVIDDALNRTTRHLTMNDLKEELGDSGGTVVDELLADIDRYPWLDANCRLPEEPVSWEEDKNLFSDIEKFIRDHIELPSEEYYATCTSWVIATYTPEEFNHRPRLIFHAPTRSGKTRALDTLRVLSYRGMVFLDPTKASLFRVIEGCRPTIFVEEGTGLATNGRDVLRSIFTGGFDVGRKIPRVLDDGDVGYFEPHCFLALSTKRLPPEDWQNRSILINMQEKTNNAIRRVIDFEEATRLRGRLLSYRLRVLCKQVNLRQSKDAAHAMSLGAVVANKGSGGDLDDRAIDIAQCLLVPGLLFGEAQRVLSVIADSQATAVAELRETLPAKVFFALNEVVRRTGQSISNDASCPDLSGFSTREVQVQLNEDLRTQGDAGHNEIPTRTVTNTLRTLGYELKSGAHNKTFFAVGDKTQKAWGTCYRKYGLRGQ